MVTFLAVRGEHGWAVERTEADGLKIVISRHYPTKYEAEVEANKLNQQALRRVMA